MNAVPNNAPRARILNVTEAEYFADPCAVPSLSQSIAHILLTRSPLHAFNAHPRLGAKGKPPKEPTKAQIHGTVIHALLLGKGSESIRVLSFGDYKTKVAQIAKAEAVAAGMTPIIEAEYEECEIAVNVLRGRLAEQGCVFEGGEAELALEWYEDSDHGPVLCRGRLDYLILGERHAKIIDPKKITQADPTTCMYHADDYGLHVQAASYTSAVEALRPDLIGRVEFEFAFMEFDEPYAAVVRPPSQSSQWAGEQRWRRAVNAWARCLSTGVWPGYPVEPLEVAPRTMAQEEAYADRELIASAEPAVTKRTGT